MQGNKTLPASGMDMIGDSKENEMVKNPCHLPYSFKSSDGISVIVLRKFCLVCFKHAHRFVAVSYVKVYNFI